MAFMFENLGIYQKAVDFTNQIISLAENFSHGYYFTYRPIKQGWAKMITGLIKGLEKRAN